MSNNAIDGVEIPYDLDSIAAIDPDIVGHATLFKRIGRVWQELTRLEGNIRELLLVDYSARKGQQRPELVMYSGTRD